MPIDAAFDEWRQKVLILLKENYGYGIMECGFAGIRAKGFLR
jgi:hypothetical protein